MMNVFKEARIILPMAADAEAVTAVETRLVAAFGGFTSYTGTGAWRASDGHPVVEAVRVYDVAVPAFMAGYETHAWHGASAELREIARDAARAMAQACVYLRLPDGEVHLVNPTGADINPDVARPSYQRSAAFWNARNAGVM
jgi:hypothetical protein